MKVSFSKVITKKWKSHLEVWVAKRHLRGWLLAKSYVPKLRRPSCLHLPRDDPVVYKFVF